MNNYPFTIRQLPEPKKDRFTNQLQEHLNHFSFMRGRGTGCKTIDNPNDYSVGDLVRTIDFPNTRFRIVKIEEIFATLSNNRRVQLSHLIKD